MVERATHNGLVAGSIPARPIIMSCIYTNYNDLTGIYISMQIYGYPDKPKQYGSNVMHSEWLCNYITMVNKEMVLLIKSQLIMSKALGEHLCPKCLQPKHNSYDSTCSVCYWRNYECEEN